MDILDVAFIANLRHRQPPAVPADAHPSRGLFRLATVLVLIGMLAGLMQSLAYPRPSPMAGRLSGVSLNFVANR
jgi:hypothetical protein